MSIFTKIADALGGSVIKEGFNVIKSYFPPSMTDQEKAAAELAYQQFAHDTDMQLRTQLNEAEQEFNQRIKDLEGTATDLKTIPIIGHIIIFLRGAQRPAWGIFTLYADYMIFSGSWIIPTGDAQRMPMLFAINILVLGFLFGERAVKNLTPFIMQFFGVKKEGD